MKIELRLRSWRAMAASRAVTFLKATLLQASSTRSYYSGENPRIRLLDRTMAALRRRVPSWGHRLWSSAGWLRKVVERLHLARALRWSVRSCLAGRCYAQSCLSGRCYARQFLRRLQATSTGGTRQHGAEVSQWRPLVRRCVRAERWCCLAPWWCMACITSVGRV